MTASPSAAALRTETAYRPDIDGLRAIAVLGVLFYHAFPKLLPGGFSGVDVFFVISGYLITGLLLLDFRAGTFSILNFYVRRIRRIFPALLAMLLAVWLLGWVLLMPSELRELGKSMVHSAYFANNFQLVAQAGYFDTDAELKPLLHLWSLAVEEQFYIIWPWLLLVFWRLHTKAKWLTALIAGTSLLLTLLLTERYPVQAFFLPHYRAWELLAGALIALNAAPLRQRLAQSRLGIASGWLGLGLIALAYLWIDGSAPYPGWRALLPVLGAVLILLAPSDHGANHRLLASRPAIAVGLISYPLYLWHWPLFAYARILYGTPGRPLLIALALCAVLLSWATYRWLELPIRHGARPWLRSRWLPRTALLLLILLGGLGDLSNGRNGFPQRVQDNAWNDLQWPVSRIVDARCQAEFPVRGDTCLRSGSGPLAYALIGDSHANHFFPGLAAALAKNGQGLLQIHAPVKAGDPNQANIDWLASTPSVKTVFVAYHLGRMKQADNPFGPILEGLVGQLQKAGKRVHLIVDNPEFDFEPRLCTKRPPLALRLGAGDNAAKICSESLDYMKRKRGAYEAYLRDFSARFPQVGLIDALSPLCPNGLCAAIVDDRPLFRDRNHLTAYGSEHLFAGIRLPD